MKKLLASILVISVCATTTFAADVFVVNPTSIRTQLFSKNITLLQALHNVQNSKLNVSMARSKLLPSLNLTTLLPALSNPTFLLGSVTFLFPFLVPANWAVLKQQKELLEADRVSYKALQLNILSNSLSLYYTYLNDIKVQKIFAEQSETLGKLYSSLKRQSDVLGNVTSEDLGMSHAQWEESKIRASKLQELLVEEKAGLRTLLGLPLGSELTAEDITLAPSDYESKTVFEVAEHSLAISPEVSQLNFLINAARAGKFSKLFGFLSTSVLAGTGSNGSSPFENLKVSGGFTFGMDNLVNLKIANNSIESLQLRGDQLKMENEKTAEVLIGKLDEVKKQQELSALALLSRNKVYEGQKRQYKMGFISLQSLLQTESQLTESKVNNLKTDLDLKMQRLTLQRLVIDGDFSLVKGCSMVVPEKKKGMFHFKKTQSLDQACQ